MFSKGFKVAVLYSISPHLLGFCGPQKKSATLKLLNFLSGERVSEKEIRKILENFKGSYFYYKLIAKSNNISDIFDEKIVKAYWIGNELLEKVKISDLKKIVEKDFSKPEVAKKISENSRVHHSFHVFIAGPINPKIKLSEKDLDLCRISWGKVIKISNLKSQNSKLLVEYQPVLKDKKYALEKPVKKEITWNKKFLPDIRTGDWVSIHWNQAIQILNKRDLNNLKKYTQNTLKLLNEKK